MSARHSWFGPLALTSLDEVVVERTACLAALTTTLLPNVARQPSPAQIRRRGPVRHRPQLCGQRPVHELRIIGVRSNSTYVGYAQSARYRRQDELSSAPAQNASSPQPVSNPIV